MFTVGNLEYTVQVRDCIPGSALTSASSGCHDGITGAAEDIVNEMFTFISVVGIEVSGISCYCSTDLCDAMCSGFSLFNIW